MRKVGLVPQSGWKSKGANWSDVAMTGEARIPCRQSLAVLVGDGMAGFWFPFGGVHARQQINGGEALTTNSLADRGRVP